MALPFDNLADQMSQLDTARNVVLGDAALYPQIVQGILPIIGAKARIELRRWGADFLAETFASPALAQQPKQKLSTQVVQTLWELLENPEEDASVVKGVIQTAASIYPLVFRTIIDNSTESALWEKMTAIKQNILKRWDTASNNIKACCIKFVQKVVQVQTTGVISDPRRPEQNETSLSIVPRNHPLIPLPNLEAEASGLLDRLLNVFNENSSDPILVNATLNCLPIMIRTRQSISSKIVNAILNFNPLKQANAPMTPTIRVNIKSMERTTRALLINLMKRNPNHPLASRIQQYLERLAQSRNDIFEEASKKRALPTEPTDLVDSAKRARLGVDTPPQLKIPPMPPGPNSFAQLFTLTDEAGLTSFDVKQLPADLIVKITVPVLSRVDPEAVRSRYLTLSKKQVFEQQSSQHTAPIPAAGIEEDDDYEPEYQPMDIPTGTHVPTGSSIAGNEQFQPDLVALGPFVLPQPPPLTEEEAAEIGKGAIERVFNMISTLEKPSKSTKGSQKPGFGRLAASSFDRDSWLVLLTRLATRASAGLEVDETDENFKAEDGRQLLLNQRISMANGIREMLYRYVLEDFRVRINAAISWMNEEWYNDQIQLKYAATEDNGEHGNMASKHYEKWVMRLLEGILPYLDSKDKVLIRFLSEIPELSPKLVQKTKSLANDPERVALCVQALHYLVLVRPPARELCLDALQDLYTKVDEAGPLVSKILLKWRPHAIPNQENSTSKPNPISTTQTPRTASPSTDQGQGANFNPRAVSGGNASNGVKSEPGAAGIVDAQNQDIKREPESISGSTLSGTPQQEMKGTDNTADSSSTTTTVPG
ncbi:mRNA cleavage and polyadenylation specificity factor complex subunit [Histoplasma capsulatum var. duboisii H88]|uniref:mRNA cleavage and polyadenylation specificity factor complex subunit n=1 Tax=Ajellomyces capsulatus (strain H88) TaxID=544711 RepID=F0UE99_AJEC8|nr:mRNA cleavage and polyadenylation specificity factor complex subunit [Histoplasma capsulatum var. duboisii H88]